MKIYFAGSIRGGRDNKKIYPAIICLLKEYGEVLIEHVGDQKLSVMGEAKLSDDYICNRDMRWLNDSDVIVAEVTTPSLGIGYEIGKMEDKKPILCLFCGEKCKNKLSAMIAGNKKVNVENYNDLSDIKKILERFFRKIK